MRARAAVPSCLSHAWDTWDNLGQRPPGRGAWGRPSFLLLPPSWGGFTTPMTPWLIDESEGGRPILPVPCVGHVGQPGTAASWAGCMGSSVIFASAPFLGWVHDADDALAN